MKTIVNILGAVLILAVAVLVLGRIRQESAYHVSTPDLQRSLLAVLPDENKGSMSVSTVQKAGAVYVSTTLGFSDEAAFDRFVGELKNQKWQEAKTPLTNTRIFCREGAVYKVVSPSTASDNSGQYYLETSSGNYVFYCKRG